MGSLSISQKPHAVLVPFPAQGHVIPLMRLAKLLHAKGFYITFVNTEFNHKRLIKSKGPESVEGFEDFKFETIPDGLPPSDKDATQEVPVICDATRKNCLVPFKELLVRLNSCSEAPPVSCVISDGVMSFGIKAAADLGIPQVQFWTASACSFVGYLHYRELIERGIVPFKKADRFFTTNFNEETYTKKGLAWVNTTESLKDVLDRHYPEMTKRWMNSSSAFSVWDSVPESPNPIPLYLRVPQ